MPNNLAVHRVYGAVLEAATSVTTFRTLLDLLSTIRLPWDDQQ